MKQRALDRVLRGAIARAGAPNGLRFTERQLYYEVCRSLLPAHLLPRRPSFTVPAALSYPTFRTMLDRHAPIPGLLEPSRPQPVPVGRHTPEPDLFDYGLPRLLVCQSHAVATMLRANGMPMESGCPVLSAAELPVDPRLVAMLELAGAPTIYVLHDGSTEGLAFPRQLPSLTEVPDSVRLVAIGLRPAQAWPLHLTHGRGAQVTEPSAASGREHAWLRRGRATEVEAVRPAVLLRSVHRLVREVPRAQAPLIEVRRVRHAGFLTWPTA